MLNFLGYLTYSQKCIYSNYKRYEMEKDKPKARNDGFYVGVSMDKTFKGGSR